MFEELENYFNMNIFQKIQSYGGNMLVPLGPITDLIFGILKKQIITTRFNLTSEINLFLADDSSTLHNLDKYCENFFKTNIKKIIENDKYLEKKNLEKHFSSCLGGIKIIKDGWETEAIPVIGKKRPEKKGFFAKFFEINQ